MENSKIKIIRTHSFHIVTTSPWPFLVSLSLYALAITLVVWFHYDRFFLYLALFNFFSTIFYISLWLRDVILEGTFLGDHTKKVQNNLKLGFILFMISEIMFFFSFFWTFLHSALSPSIWINCCFPPPGLELIVVIFKGIPVLGTISLLLSAATITWAHKAMISALYYDCILALTFTIIPAIFFIFLQIIEYITLPLEMSDGIYGSCFYILTGFHGLHVIAGTIFIIVSYYRQIMCHFTPKHHIGFECAVWYWHFVDVVWIYLVILLYVWGSDLSNILK